MTQALDVVMLREIGLSTVGIDGEAMHLLHVRNRKGETATFGLSNEHLSAFILRAQDCLAKGLGYGVGAS